jgi:NAD(P)H-hydrate repair Nnr-like enzyme with NAD(P)H-hydrate dehydratase domain
METIPLPRLPERPVDSHKGDYGKVLIIAGSELMIGAPAMVGLASLRTGSGLVRIAAPREIIPAVLTICPCATAFAWSATKIKDLLAYAEEHDVLAVGPGLGNSPAVKRLILELVERHHGPMVFDADALNALSTLDSSEWPKRRNWGNIVLTPHMGEYMRLMSAVMKRGADVALTPDAARTHEPVGVAAAAGAIAGAAGAEGAKKTRSLVDDDDGPSTADGVVLDMPEDTATLEKFPDGSAKPQAPAQPDRTPLAELLARGTGTVVVLKGHRTVVTDGARVYINNSGNPAMATAGSGDVLTGIIASLIGQKLSVIDAATLGVHLHGLAGDLARAAIAPNAAGIIASDITSHVPQALSQLVASSRGS